MAKTDLSGDWGRKMSPSLDEMSSLAHTCFAHLPLKIRGLCSDVSINVVDFPDDQLSDDMELESPFELLGLFEGQGIGTRFSFENSSSPNRMTLFRRAILDYWAENEETLSDVINYVLIHEISQHFGLSDEDIDEIEAAVA